MSRASVQPELFARPEFEAQKRARRACSRSTCGGLAATLLLVGCGTSSPPVHLRSPRGATEPGAQTPTSTDRGSPRGADVPSATRPEAPTAEVLVAGPDSIAVPDSAAMLTPGSPVQVLWERGLVQLQASKAAVRVALLKAERGLGVLMLDDERWRRVPPGGVRLDELLPEDEEPSPGRHRLVGCQVDGEKFRCEALSFVLGRGLDGLDVRADDQPRCVLFEPGGTFWGGAEVPLLVLGSGGPGDSVVNPLVRASLELRGPGGEVHHFDIAPGRRDTLRLGAGDYEVSVSCGHAATARTITVNLLEAGP